MTLHPVTWFQREPTGGTLYIPPCLSDTVQEPSRPARKPESPKPGRPPRAGLPAWMQPLANELTALDPRVQVEPAHLQPEPCGLCCYFDCDGDTEVTWTPARSERDSSARVNQAHLPGWLSGFVSVECGDPDVHVVPIIVRVGAA